MAYSPVKTRLASPADAAALCTLLNEIIRVGGTTANQTEFTEESFAEAFLQGGDHICCYVALDEAGAPAGFQHLEHRSKLPADWGDIATFARLKPKLPGVGTALFARTLRHANAARLAAINATIRADNTGGLKFYEKMGFEIYKTDAAVPLKDGTPIDRISKRYLLDH